MSMNNKKSKKKQKILFVAKTPHNIPNIVLIPY